MIPVGQPYRTVQREGATLRLRTARVAEAAGDATVVLRPDVVGVCRSDLRELADDRYLRRDFGHEIVGRVVAVQPDGLFPPGARVVYDPHPRLERTCGFADLVELSGASHALRSALVPVPEPVAPLAAVFAEPLACAVHCVRKLTAESEARGLRHDSPVAVIGAGMAGALIAAVLSAGNVPVRLLNRGTQRLEFLRSKGFLPARAVDGGADGQRFPRVVLATATATPEMLSRAVESAQPDGLLVLFAGTGPDTTLFGQPLDRVRRDEQVVSVMAGWRALTVAGTHGALAEDFRDSLALLSPAHPAALARRVEQLVTDLLTLEEAVDVLPRRIHDGFLGKAVVRFPHYCLE